MPTKLTTPKTTKISALIPVRSIDRVNVHGKEIRQVCAHPLIPGLDADFCRSCQIYWVDQHMISRLLNKRKKISDFDEQ